MIYTNDPNIVKLGLFAFPAYTGKKFQCEFVDYPISVISYWDGGTRDYFVMVKNDLSARLETPETRPGVNDLAAQKGMTPPPGYCLVCNRIFCGKSAGLSLYFNKADQVLMLPDEAVSLSEGEKAVLWATQAFKSFCRVDQYLLSKWDDWDENVLSLKAKGMLQKNGAITNKGRNAISDKTSCWFYTGAKE